MHFISLLKHFVWHLSKERCRTKGVLNTAIAPPPNKTKHGIADPGGSALIDQRPERVKIPLIGLSHNIQTPAGPEKLRSRTSRSAADGTHVCWENCSLLVCVCVYMCEPCSEVNRRLNRGQSDVKQPRHLSTGGDGKGQWRRAGRVPGGHRRSGVFCEPRVKQVIGR